MRLILKQPYLSIQEMNEFDLPGFSVLIGRNGVGKTQLLDAIAKGAVSVSDLALSEIDKYDINTFQPTSSGAAGWGGPTFFAERTAERYFSMKPGPAPIETAETIFSDTLKAFQLGDGSKERHQFEEELRNQVRQMPDFEIFPNIKGDAALSSYSRAILNDVIKPLNPKKQQSSTSRSDGKGSCGNNPAILVSLAMKLTGKFPHELLRDDVLRTASYEGATIGNDISQAFVRYKVEQYSWAHTQGETSEKSVRTLLAEYRQRTCPPWVMLRRSLDLMREASDDPELFNFEFSDPEQDWLNHADHRQYSFETQFRNRATKASYRLENLSSGEKILMSLCLATFNRTMGRRQPKLMLLDELDALLHPSMALALIAGLKDQFVNNDTRVIMATHSVTTVSILEDGEIVRLGRNGGTVDVQPVSKSKAVAELSEGLATIDTGLSIAASDGAAPITILTEGHNALHLRKWVDLFVPGKVHVFCDLPDKTGKDQLLTYGRLLAKMSASSHFLIVWDCDAKGKARELANELSGSAIVTAFSFEKRENGLAPKGIENKYDEKFLENYSTIVSEAATGKEIARSMSDSKKSEFARHVFSNGTEEYFKHFDDLRTTVEELLRKTGCN